MQKTAPRLVIVTAAAMLVGGCSVWDSLFGGGGEPIDFESELGPNTEALVDQLPGGLIGDRDNASHSGERRPDLPGGDDE